MTGMMIEAREILKADLSDLCTSVIVLLLLFKSGINQCDVSFHCNQMNKSDFTDRRLAAASSAR